MGATKVGQFLEPADVLAGQDHQAIELWPADHDDVLVEVLGHIGRNTPPVVASQLLRNCTR